MSRRPKGGSGGSGGSGGARGAKPGRRLLVIAAILGALLFAVQGGEYSTLDLLRQRNRDARLRAEIDSLRQLVDSLERYRKRLLTDPALQERIAREEFGMVRGEREMLYRFVEPADSGPGGDSKGGSGR